MLWVLLDGEPAAVCRLADRVRSESSKAIAALRQLTLALTPNPNPNPITL